MSLKKLAFFGAALLSVLGCTSEKKCTKQAPKVVVTIVVDQMRAEYLYRFNKRFGNDGFNRLVNGGFNCKNVHFTYIPTFTGPGHASLFSGTVPRYHGIVGNSWYDRVAKKVIYCVADDSVATVGSNDAKGQVSPKYLLSTTIADELELFTQKRSLTYSLSLKDRAAVLSAGHMADGVFWYNNTNGQFISSSYYTKELPGWVLQFNSKGLADSYMQADWDLYYPLGSYEASMVDDNPYEQPGKVIRPIDKPIFPYHLAELGKQHSPYDLLIHTPWGNTLLADFAIEAINNNPWGADDITDLLMISFSSTDAIGHLWGPQSKEVEDTYIRLDFDIARILKALDAKLGRDNYLVMLTADHAVGEISAHLRDNGIPSGYFSIESTKALADSVLDRVYGQADWVEYVRNHLIYLNHEVLEMKKIDIAEASLIVARALQQLDGVAQVLTSSQLMENEYQQLGTSNLQKGFNPKRSGDILILLEPAWSGYPGAAADHGSQYTYDSHVPLLWYGNGIEHGESVEHQGFEDIATTLNLIMHTNFTNAGTGKPLKGVWFDSH